MAGTMVRKLVSVLFVLTLSLPAPGHGRALLQERDWMIGLVDALGLSFGLPDQPADADYQAILSGDRHLRIEAENHLQPTDPVSVQSFLSFGPFSGPGWLSGVAETTTVHLRFVVPHSGQYHLAAALRRGGFTFAIGDRKIAADGELTFTRVDLGLVALESGEQEFKVQIPPNGALDYLELTASPLPAIAPLQGWQPEQPLTAEIMAVTLVQILGLYDLLPPSDRSYALEAEELALLQGATITNVAHLGQPSDGAWVRAGAATTEVDLIFDAPRAATFDLELRGVSDTAVSALLNGREQMLIAFLPYLASQHLGTFYLSEQPHRLTLRLPPRSGADVLYLRERLSDAADFMRLVGLSDSSPPGPMQMDQLLALLTVLAPPR
jgi:hypothetical protein